MTFFTGIEKQTKQETSMKQTAALLSLLGRLLAPDYET
jgi:hypothetical protein